MNRREAIKAIVTTGAGFALPTLIRGQASPIIVAGRPVEIVVRPLTEFTVRISLLPVVGARHSL
jgi:hypothetical protein